nr:GNAT family protein [Dyella sp. ASV24]
MRIKGKLVTLRAIERCDLPRLNEWANDPEIQGMLGGWHFPTSLHDQEVWYAALSCQSLNQRFAVEDPDGNLIGTASLVSIDWKNRNAFHGLLIGDTTARRKGYGVDVVMALMRYAFDELGLYRLDTDIIEYNENSLRLHIDKCGWQKEGSLAGWYYRNGKRWSKIIVGITSEHYRLMMLTKPYW